MGTINRMRGARWARPALATAAVAAVAVMTALGVTGTADAGTAPATAPVPPGGTWGTGADIPGAAALASAAPHDPSSRVTALSCTAPGDCVAVGSYTASYNVRPYIATEVNGIWGQATEVPVPGANFGLLDAVSCASAGNCAAAGQFYPTSDLTVQQPFVIDEKGGTWGTARPVTGMTSASSWQAGAPSISCGAAGDCALAGTYTVLGATTQTSYSYAYVASEVAGTWQPAQSVTGIPYPAGVTSPESFLTTVSCDAAGYCAAGGYFGNGTMATQTQTDEESWPLLITAQGGTWSAPQPVPGLPAPSADWAGEVTSVSCPAAGDCGAAGRYASGTSPWLAFIANESSSAWAGALTVPAIPGAASDPETRPVALSCWSAGDCVMAGTYIAGTTSSSFVVDELDGVITSAQQVPGVATLDSEGAQATALSCAPDGYCAVGGLGIGPGFVADRVNGTWTTARPVTGTPDPDRGIAALSCPAAGWCTAGGSYDASGMGHAFTVAQATATTLTVKFSTPTLTYGSEQSETLTTTVSGAGGTPTGTVTITRGSATVCVITLSGGTGGCPLSATTLPAGAIPLTFAYSGDPSFVAATVGPGTMTVAPEASRLSLVISPARVTYHTPYKVTYTVKASPAVAGVPTGKVAIEYSFVNASHVFTLVPVCTATLSGGAGTCTTTRVFTPGYVQTYALYNGDGNFKSAEAIADLMVVRAASLASLTLSRSSVAYGHENGEKLAVKVTSPQGGTPAGSVVIRIRSTTICTIRLVNGTGGCTLSASRLKAGSYPLDAFYEGSTYYLTGTSAAKTLKVTG